MIFIRPENNKNVHVVEIITFSVSMKLTDNYFSIIQKYFLDIIAFHIQAHIIS